MQIQNLNGGLSDEELNAYDEEVMNRWGDTEAFRQSQERVPKMTDDDWSRIRKEEDELMELIVELRDQEPASESVQILIDRHYNNLRHFYEPNLELYRGLADMYVDDPRFRLYYDKYAPGLADFMHDAMIAYCDAQEK